MTKIPNNFTQNLIFIIIISGFLILSAIEYLQSHTRNSINLFKSKLSGRDKKRYPIPLRNEKQNVEKNSGQNEIFDLIKLPVPTSDSLKDFLNVTVDKPIQNRENDREIKCIEKTWYPNEKVKYHDVPKRLIEHLTANPITAPQKLLDMFKNIKPWRILNSNLIPNPEKAILPFIHIPKTAGSEIKVQIDLLANNKKWKYRSSLFPRSMFDAHQFNQIPNLIDDSNLLINGSVYKKVFHTSAKELHHIHVKSQMSPGCRFGGGHGGTHCGYSEINECLVDGYANLLHDYDESVFLYENFFRYKLRKREKILENPKKFWDSEVYEKMIKILGFSTSEIEDQNSNLTTNFKNSKWSINYYDQTSIKYISVLRHPVTRTISEFYWWKPTSKESNTYEKCVNNKHGWTAEMCDISLDEGFEAWLYKNKTLFESNLNTGLNRQTRSLYPISPEMRKKVFSLDETFENKNRQHVDCSNIDGIQAKKEISEFFSGESIENRKSKDYWQIIIDTIENIEENFAFIFILEKFERSLLLLKHILEYQNLEDLRKQVQQIKTKDEDFYDDIFESLEEDDPFANNRVKRSSHSSPHPKDFETDLIVKIAELNQWDLILYLYFKKKMEISLQEYGFL